MNKTIITQIIFTVQGEGLSVGTPVLLIRVGNCNLNCEWCDTKWSNNLKLKSIKSFTPKIKVPFTIDKTNLDEFMNYLNREFLDKFSVNTILLTGGEPLMNKEFIASLIYNSKSTLKNITKIEIETNGTLLNDETDKMLFYNNCNKTIQINISPKLDPSYYRSNKINTLDDIIDLFNKNNEVAFQKILSETLTTITWKFVYSKANEKSIEKFIRGVGDISNISIMPLTPDYLTYDNEMKFLEDFRQSSYDAIDYCMRTGYTFSGRQHIWLFNNFLHRDEYMDVRKNNQSSRQRTYI